MRMQDVLFSLIKSRRELDPTSNYVLFLGAGASLSSGASLFSTIIGSTGAVDHGEFSAVVELLSDSERYLLLHPHVSVRTPSTAAIRLARLIKDGYFSLVFTTNFDSVLELAFQEAGMGPDDYQLLVNDPTNPLSNLSILLQYSSPRVKLIKLHGDFRRRNYALTEQETQRFATGVASALADVFSHHDAILLGTKFADVDLLRSIPPRCGSLWYVNPNPPEGDLEALIAARHSQGQCITGSDGIFDSFVEQLYEFIHGGADPNLSLRWHILAPCFLAEPFSPRTLPANLILQSNIASEASFLLEAGDGAPWNLAWFADGTAVWHCSQDLRVASVFDYALLRRKLYGSLLHGRHEVCLVTRELLNSLREFGFPPATGLGYALSCVELVRTAWPARLLPNGLRLLCCPTLLDDSSVADERELSAPKSGLQDEGSNPRLREALLLREGLDNEEFVSLGIPGKTAGYASWAGVAWQCITPPLEVSEKFLRFEFELQACWWYLHHASKLIESGAMSVVKDHYHRTRIARRITGILTINPTEHTVARRFREAIISTSRIASLWNNFRALLASEEI
jgi:hypothetical protein